MVYFERIKINDFKNHIKNGCRIVDFRHIDDFSGMLIPGTLYLNIDKNFEQHSELFLFPDQAIILVLDEDNEEKIAAELKRLNFSNIKGVLEGGINQWAENNNPLDVLISISPEELMLEMNHGHMQVFDIRPKGAYDLKHLEDSENISVDHFISDYDLIDKNSEMCILCENGDLSMSLISYLKINGIHNVYHVEGGFKELERSDYFSFEITPYLN